jgi:hypothetical protein
MRQFKTRSALMRHWECKLAACRVAVTEGGIDVTRNVLIDMAQKRTYDASRRCKGFAAVTKAVQQHRLLSHTPDAHKLHVSAASTAYALVQFADHLLTEAGNAAATHPCAQLVADAMGAMEEHIWEVQLYPALLQSHSDAAMKTEPACRSNVVSSGVQRWSDVPRYPACPVQRLADGIQTDADRQFMLVMALALAGRVTVEIVDEGRLQAWLAAQPQGQGPAGHLSAA